MIRRPVLTRLASGLAVVALLVAAGAAAAPLRIFQSANAWYSVTGGRFTYALFYADKPDGTRDYGVEQSADGVFARVKSTAPSALARVGIRLDAASDCVEERAKNPAGASGWAFACTFPQATGAGPPTPAAPPPPERIAAAVAAPVVIAARATPQPVKAEPLKVLQASAPAAPKPPVVAVATTVRPTPSATPMIDASDTLNAKVKARSDAVDARNNAAEAQFEAQKAAFEAEKKAQQETYAAQLAAHDAEVKALERKHQAEIEAWQARVKACKAGDLTQCGN